MGRPVHHYLSAMVQLNQRTWPELPPGVNYRGPYEFVLVNGVEYSSAPLSRDEYDLLVTAVRAARINPQPRQCFYTAQMVATADRTTRLVYHEGYAVGRTIPVHHGWLVVGGKVVDLTWRAEKPLRSNGRWRDRVLGVQPDGWQYVGVPYASDLLRDRMCRTGRVVAMLDDWYTGDPPQWSRPRPLVL